MEALSNVTVTAVACGAFHSLAVTSSGRLYEWGLVHTEPDSKDEVNYGRNKRTYIRGLGAMVLGSKSGINNALLTPTNRGNSGVWALEKAEAA